MLINVLSVENFSDLIVLLVLDVLMVVNILFLFFMIFFKVNVYLYNDILFLVIIEFLL